MSTIATMERQTPTSVWQTVAGSTIGDELLEWPPARIRPPSIEKTVWTA